jgi:hypothetical protein
MASTYSTSLRLELMATGDQSGTWGDTTNTNLGTLLEQAITGVLSVAQGDVANLTLTALDGASDQSRNAVVNLTGAMTAARNVVVPDANKLYLIKNSTSGGFAITVKTAAGSGVTVPPGTARWVYADGTNVVDGMSGPWSPSSNDAQALGLSGTAWADLFLASGGVINWNAGDVTVTHSANTLAFAGASSGYTFDAVISGTTASFSGAISAVGVTFTGATPLTLTYVDAGALVGPTLDLYRDSSTPAINDVMGKVAFNGKDSGGNKTEYASVGSLLVSATNGNESGAVVIRTINSGTEADRFLVGNGLYSATATNGDRGLGTINALAYYKNGSQIGPVMGTPVATTSGTEVLFSGIPAGAKRIVMTVAGLSTSGTSAPLIQIGDAGGIEATGYLGASSLVAAGVATTNFTTGCSLTGNTGAWLATTVYHAEIDCTLLDASTFTWLIKLVGAASNLAQTYQGVVSKSLSAELDRIRIVAANGTDTFDAGTANIMYWV